MKLIDKGLLEYYRKRRDTNWYEDGYLNFLKRVISKKGLMLS